MTISATIIKDSENENSVRITTFELVYPRIVHSELMTHRLFSRNSASSRAIPVKAMLELIEKDPAMPSHWGKNQAGMQADEELDDTNKAAAKGLWLEACKQAVSVAKVMADIGVHKQVINRITEPFQHMKVVLTATEFNNWWYLRDHKDADPTIRELAVAMRKEYMLSLPEELNAGLWHMPYVKSSLEKGRGLQMNQTFYDEDNVVISLEQALKISVSCCAQVSYRKQDTSLDKAEKIYQRLIESKPCHASPTEHQAQSVYNRAWDLSELAEGITHQDREGVDWSGNFREWVQYRQILTGNVVTG